MFVFLPQTCHFILASRNAGKNWIGEKSIPSYEDMDENIVYLEISIAGATSRKVSINLFTEECPITCRNFKLLCSSREQAKRPKSTQTSKPSSSSVPRTYRNTEFHRIIPGFMVQGGDYQNFNGTGGESYDGGTFPDESFVIRHDQEGIVSMANRGKDTNGSQFFITLARTPHLDGKHVAFGRVIEGMDVVRDMAKVETEGNSGKPIMLQRVIITDCGVESQNSETKSTQKKAKKDKRKSRNEERFSSSDESDYSSSYDSSSDDSSTSRKHRREKKKKSYKHRKKHKDRKRDRSESRKSRRRDTDDESDSSESRERKKSRSRSSHHRSKKSKRKKKKH